MESSHLGKLKEAGLAKEGMKEARAVRDAEKNDPGIVRQARNIRRPYISLDLATSSTGLGMSALLPESGLELDIAPCPESAANGRLVRRSITVLLNYLIGAAQQWQGHRDTECFGCLEIQ